MPRDSNSGFFFSVVKERISKNFINAVYTNFGVKLSTSNDIKVGKSSLFI